ncbi:MAG: diaminopimelate decarboxylase [Elusimicrobia bacterium RIFOXYA2_FULL_39_19]|nr:MAG: diaminopimelate decarboxylase [Elusimicrobia bacterium RIFOXYA2_FULL_39_19]
MFHYKNNRLYCENVPVETLADKAGTPLYVYSKNKLIENLNNYQQAFGGVNHLLCYAVKANSNAQLCKELFSRGAGADVTSGGELFRALKAGAKPEKIVFAGVGKSEDEIRYALKERIYMFNAESTEEIGLINKIAGQLKTKARLALRINPNVDAHTHKYITTGKSENKFGIAYQKAVEVYAFAKTCNNLTVSGIHCHIGSQITSVKPFYLMAKKMAELFMKLKKTGINIEHIDIGGGLGIKYHNEVPPNPQDLAKAVLPVLKPLNTKIILEPGRYITGNAGALVTKVIYRKAGLHKKFLIVDAGFNDLIRPALYEAYHLILPVNKSAHSHIADVVGPICETGDFLGKNRRLPLVKQGGLLAVMCAGAYGFAMSSQYNSRRRAAEVLVDKNNFKIVRKRETYEDLISKENSR